MRLARAFTLIEILIVIGIIAILAGLVIVAVNPARQFAQARNAERTGNVNALLNAIGQNMAENRGVFTCPGGDPLPVPGIVATTSLSGPVHVNLRPCLVPAYLPELPVDPGSPFAKNTCITQNCTGAGEDYNTEYTVTASTTGRVTVCAPYGTESAIPGSGPICVTR